uniref:No apical meristem-associated C-terminal domain-containing protein n=1 Tax=Lactuca sativa TaxID=4236 RepID=A0A9R1V4R7_LACSA|nr:hypothetical protein LSAT_V11C600322770 [Lactuca sativa]
MFKFRGLTLKIVLMLSILKILRFFQILTKIPSQIIFKHHKILKNNQEEINGMLQKISLMSAWCFANEDKERGKNKTKASLWAQIKLLYDAARVENPEKLNSRNEDQMRGRFKRLNENAQKWVGVYREAWRRRRSGVSQKDIENKAHKLYEASGNKFNDIIVFNEVMCKHEKWVLELDHDTTRSRPECEVGNEESGGSSKRSKTTEEGEFCVHSNPETPTSDGSMAEMQQKKRKGKASNEIVTELRAMRLARESELEVMKKRIDLDKEMQKQRIDLDKGREQKTDERELVKMQLLHLNTLLQKEHLSLEEENMKHFLMSKFYGN